MRGPDETAWTGEARHRSGPMTMRFRCLSESWCQSAGYEYLLPDIVPRSKQAPH